MTGQPRKWHKTIGGNSEDAVKYGLTLKAHCGLVWVPQLLANPKDRPDIEECRDCFPARPHYVYRCYDDAGQLLYVGCTATPPSRFRAHAKNSWWWSQVARTRLTVWPRKEVGLERERIAIATEGPIWNVRGQDRGLWSAEDYAEHYETALAWDAPETVTKRLAREAHRRYGLTLGASA